ncbi:uncharacterized protein [Penaeus vannamei]|uniref:uncharacterized protein n=1 Tax=Penaeus vannamei TaxID=6689 RepID=UPI00387F53F1
MTRSCVSPCVPLRPPCVPLRSPASPCVPLRPPSVPPASPCVPLRPPASPYVLLRPPASPCVPLRLLASPCVPLRPPASPCVPPDRPITLISPVFCFYTLHSNPSTPTNLHAIIPEYPPPPLIHPIAECTQTHTIIDDHPHPSNTRHTELASSPTHLSPEPGDTVAGNSTGVVCGVLEALEDFAKGTGYSPPCAPRRACLGSRASHDYRRREKVDTRGRGHRRERRSVTPTVGPPDPSEPNQTQQEFPIVNNRRPEFAMTSKKVQLVSSQITPWCEYFILLKSTTVITTVVLNKFSKSIPNIRASSRYEPQCVNLRV